MNDRTIVEIDLNELNDLKRKASFFDGYHYNDFYIREIANHLNQHGSFLNNEYKRSGNEDTYKLADAMIGMCTIMLNYLDASLHIKWVNKNE